MKKRNERSSGIKQGKPVKEYYTNREGGELYETEADATKTLLNERGRTHGDFTDHARYTQQIKDVIRRAGEERIERRQSRLTSVQEEALDMIAHKIGRILAGNPNFKDHWDDIEGYARLASERVID